MCAFRGWPCVYDLLQVGSGHVDRSPKCSTRSVIFDLLFLLKKTYCRMDAGGEEGRMLSSDLDE